MNLGEIIEKYQIHIIYIKYCSAPCAQMHTRAALRGILNCDRCHSDFLTVNSIYVDMVRVAKCPIIYI